MLWRHRAHRRLRALVSIVLAVLPAGAIAQEYPRNAVVSKDVWMELSIGGFFHATIPLSGIGVLEWADPMPEGPMLVTRMRWMHFDLSGSIGGGPVKNLFVNLAPMPQSLGEATGLPPGEWCPAESFFDLFPMVMAESLLPGTPLHTNEPVHLGGILHGMPFYYDTLQTAPDDTVVLYDPAGDPRGSIRFWRERVLPNPIPEAHVWVETSRGSDLARVENDTVSVRAALSGGLRPDWVAFGIRPAMSGEPFTIFDVDMDGREPTFSTTGPMGSGDGWAGHLDVNIHVPVESFFDIFAEASVPGVGSFFDTVRVAIDPTPPFPIDISIPPDSVGYVRRDTVFQVTCVVPEEDTSRVVMRVFPLATEKHRALRPVDQYGVDFPDTNMNDMACGPTAAACCLDYWAGNGYPRLDWPNGYPTCSAEGISPADRAVTLAGHMGTSPDTGTTQANMVAGIKSYLGSMGMSGWSVSAHDVDGVYGMAGMFADFEADEEDVIMLVSSVDANGDTVGHAVTLGSKASMMWEQDIGHARVLGKSFRLDFMDPDGGGSTEDNEYNVEWDSEGNPVIDGYDIGTGNPTRIESYIKVSPPSGSGGYLTVRRAPAQQEWISVCETRSTGDGLPDTLLWDTHGFEGGAYLLEIVVTDPAGRVGRDIRLCGIPEFVMDGDAPPAGRGLDLRPPYPNPFNPGTTIEYSLAVPAKVTVAVYDASGRLVRTLIAGERVVAGSHRISWNGENESGVPVASGAYFCRVSADGRAASAKLILVR